MNRVISIWRGIMDHRLTLTTTETETDMIVADGQQPSSSSPRASTNGVESQLDGAVDDRDHDDDEHVAATPPSESEVTFPGSMDASDDDGGSHNDGSPNNHDDQFDEDSDDLASDGDYGDFSYEDEQYWSELAARHPHMTVTTLQTPSFAPFGQTQSMNGGGWQPPRPGEMISVDDDDDETPVNSSGGRGVGEIDLTTLSSDSETEQATVIRRSTRRRRPLPGDTTPSTTSATNDDDEDDDEVEIVGVSTHPGPDTPQVPRSQNEQPPVLSRKRRRPPSSSSSNGNAPNVAGGAVSKNDARFDGKRAESTSISMENNEAIEQFKRALKCSICLDHIQEMTSTICGHVYCSQCIRLAIRVTGKCPLCQRKLRPKDLHGLFF